MGNASALVLSAALLLSAAGVRAQDAVVHLRADGAPAGFSILRGTLGQAPQTRAKGRFARLCAAPCDVTLRTGTTTLLLDHAGGTEVIGRLTVDGDATLTARVVSHDAARAWLWTASAGTFAGSIATLVGALVLPSSDSAATPLLVTSIVLTVVSVVLACFVEVAHDDVDVRVDGDAALRP